MVGVLNASVVLFSRQFFIRSFHSHINPYVVAPYVKNEIIIIILASNQAVQVSDLVISYFILFY